MKKIFVFLLLMVVSFTLKAQYPIQQNLGGDSTIIYIKGAARTVGGFINGTYTDTAAANLTRIRQYEAAQIFTTNDSAVWIRTVGAKKWVRLGSESGGSGANIYNSDGSLTGNRILSSVGHSLQFTGLSNFLVDDVVGELVLGTSATNRLRVSSGFTAFLSLDADSLLMTRLPQSQLLSTDSVLIRTADFKVKTRAVSSIGSTYTAGNGLTLSGSQFKLGGTLSENTNIVVDNGFRMGFDLDPSDAIFSVSTNNSDTVLKIVNDNRIYLPQIFTVSSTTGRKVALIDTATGKVERIDPASLVSTPTLQQVLTAGSTLTTDNTIGGGGNTLNINNLWGLYIEAGNGRGIVMDDEDGQPYEVKIYQTVNSANESSVELSESSVVLRTLKDLRENDLFVKNDSILFKPSLGQMNIDSLRTWSGISDTTHKKPMTWDTRNGRWEYAANWYAPVTESNTVTLTNKRWTARVGSTTSSATPTINTDNVDIYKLTAQTADITSFTTNLSGTPADGDILEIQITGTAARAITWGSSFVSTTVTLPTTTTSTNTLTVILQYYTTSSYGNNKWHCVNYY